MRFVLSGVFILIATSTVPAAGQSLFASQDTVELVLQAPFEQLLTRSNREPEFAVQATVTHTTSSGETVTIENVRITTRGNTSRRDNQCEFPKLKLTFGPQPRGSLFHGVPSVKVGTHCGEASADSLSPRFGRLMNQKAAHREAAVYRLLDVFGVPTLRARPASIRYVFSGATGAAAAAQPLVRDAMLLEDDEQVMQRLGAEREIAEERFGNARDAFSAPDTLRLMLAQAMIGNFDWCLRMQAGDAYRCNARHPLWNVLALERRDGTKLPVMYDFDLAGMVVGRHSWFDEVFNAAFAPSRVDIEVVSQVQRTRTLFNRPELDAARKAFVARKSAAYESVGRGHIDPDGAGIIKNYLDAFFAAIENDAAFYRPVVADRTARLFVDAEATQPACGDGAVPLGTPVAEQGDSTGDVMRVVVLDALWHWPSRCDAIRKSHVWVKRSSVSTEFPR